MSRSFLALALFAALSVAPAHSALLTIDVFDDGVLAGSASSATGVVHFNSTSIAGFDSVSIDANGLPALTGGDLSSTTLDVTSSGVATRTLTVDVVQTGIFVPHGVAHSTFSTNNLIGIPGPATLSSFGDGVELASHTFPAGTLVASAGPFNTGIGSLTSDAQRYVAVFHGADESFNATSELTTTPVIPEPSTWAMILMGFIGLAISARARKQVRSAFEM